MQDFQIDQKYTAALKAMNYTVEQALRDFLILQLSGRIAAFKSECEAFERKYGMNFQTFERKLARKVNAEDFAEEDDYMAWKFAQESRLFLQKQLGMFQKTVDTSLIQDTKFRACPDLAGIQDARCS
jgi:hypothetical protein